MKLRDYQKEGALFLSARECAMLLDKPGMGKTRQALAARELCGNTNTLVILPRKVMHQWVEEAGEQAKDIEYLSVDSLHLLEDREMPSIVIVDESHYLKNPDSKRWKLMMSWLKDKGMPKHLWLLTGTPWTRDVFDVWSQLRLMGKQSIDRAIGTNQHAFKAEHGVMKYIKHRRVFDSTTPRGMKLLTNQLKKVSLKRTHEEVRNQLPPVLIQSLEIEDGSWKKRLEPGMTAMNNFLMYMKQSMHGCAEVKDKTIMEIVESKPRKEKLVVFGKHVEPLERLHEKNKDRSILITGKHNAGREKSTQAIRKWSKDDELDMLVTTHKVCGTGLNLQAANHVVFLEYEWDLETLRQSLARLHRMGQERTVVLYTPYVKDSPEEYYMRAIRRKEMTMEDFKREMSK